MLMKCSKKLFGGNHSECYTHVKSQDIRYIIVEAFLNALQMSATLSNCEKGFKQSGLYPFNPDIPLNSCWAMSDISNKLSKVKQKRNGEASLLTDDDNFIRLCHYQNTDPDESISFDCIAKLKTNDKKIGRIISDLGPIHILKQVIIDDCIKYIIEVNTID